MSVEAGNDVRVRGGILARLRDIVALFFEESADVRIGRGINRVVGGGDDEIAEPMLLLEEGLNANPGFPELVVRVDLLRLFVAAARLRIHPLVFVTAVLLHWRQISTKITAGHPILIGAETAETIVEEWKARNWAIGRIGVHYLGDEQCKRRIGLQRRNNAVACISSEITVMFL